MSEFNITVGACRSTLPGKGDRAPTLHGLVRLPLAGAALRGKDGACTARTIARGVDICDGGVISVPMYWLQLATLNRGVSVNEPHVWFSHDATGQKEEPQCEFEVTFS